ncbi:MAG: hypothetical protein K2X27_00175 [Candidatus Obscuribacterales bacterium]|nr:hypothetical protein [Candidatus Obscuribacterales bacterium]
MLNSILKTLSSTGSQPIIRQNEESPELPSLALDSTTVQPAEVVESAYVPSKRQLESNRIAESASCLNDIFDDLLIDQPKFAKKV